MRESLSFAAAAAPAAAAAAEEASEQDLCIMTSDPEKNRQRVRQLVDKPGNGNCADCGAAGRLEGGSGGRWGSPTDAGHVSLTLPYFGLLDYDRKCLFAMSL